MSPPIDLEPVDGEEHLLRHKKHKTFYTNYYDPNTGETLRVTTRERDSVARARKIAKEKYKEWVTAPPKEKAETLFDDIAVEILANKKGSKRRKTYLSARNQLRHLMKFFHEKPVMHINKTDWDNYVTYCRTQTPTPKRNLNDDHKYFIMVMLKAYHKGIVPFPITARDIPEPDTESEVGRELSNEEIAALFKKHDELEKARDARWESRKKKSSPGDRRRSDLGFQMRFALKTGCRLREMLRLRAEYVNWSRSTIKLPPEITKTKKGREFPISQDLLEGIRERLAKSPSPYVFPSPKDPQKPQNDNKTAWKALLEEVNKEELKFEARWHDWRHTCATRMLRAGVPEATVSKVLGMSKKVLKRVYDHLKIDDLRIAADAVKLDFLEEKK